MTPLLYEQAESVAKYQYEVQGLTIKRIAENFGVNAKSLNNLILRKGWNRPKWYNKDIIKNETLRNIEHKGGYKLEKIVYKSEGKDFKILNGCWFNDIKLKPVKLKPVPIQTS